MKKDPSLDIFIPVQQFSENIAIEENNQAIRGSEHDRKRARDTTGKQDGGWGGGCAGVSVNRGGEGGVEPGRL